MTTGSRASFSIAGSIRSLSDGRPALMRTFFLLFELSSLRLNASSSIVSKRSIRALSRSSRLHSSSAGAEQAGSRTPPVAFSRRGSGRRRGGGGGGRRGAVRGYGEVLSKLQPVGVQTAASVSPGHEKRSPRA